jgi:hypothetical protein
VLINPDLRAALGRCPLCAAPRTPVGHRVRSEKCCHELTSQTIQFLDGRYQTVMFLRTASFDHLVGAAEQWKRHGDAKGFGCLEVDKQLDFRDLLDRQVGRLFALEDASGIDAS